MFSVSRKAGGTGTGRYTPLRRFFRLCSIPRVWLLINFQPNRNSRESGDYLAQDVYVSNSFTGEPVLSSSELAIFTGRPIGLMYSFFQSIPSD
jgi:hypothetical protein